MLTCTLSRNLLQNYVTLEGVYVSDGDELFTRAHPAGQQALVKKEKWAS